VVSAFASKAHPSSMERALSVKGMGGLAGISHVTVQARVVMNDNDQPLVRAACRSRALLVWTASVW